METANSTIGSITIEKLRNDNYHVWKHRIELVLGLRDLDQYLFEVPPQDNDSEQYKTWKRGDKKAKGIIALSLSDDHLEQVQQAHGILGTSGQKS